MDELHPRVEAALLELGVAPDVPVGVACSGGADSTALVHLLAGRPGVAVLHVDHHVRDDSDGDAAFVEQMARTLGLPFSGRGVVFTVARDGLEAALRESRYAALEEMAAELRLLHVLTAHTLDDQAETVLLRTMRGGSLAGIAPVRGIFVRPLLGIRRRELREWLAARDLTWRDDPTNDDTLYERNWVRHLLLPQLEERRRGVAKVLSQRAELARRDDAVLDALARVVIANAASDDVGVLVRDFAALPAAVATRVVRYACRSLDTDPSDPQVDAVRATTRHARCGNVDAWRLDGDLALVRSPMPVPEPIWLPPSGELEVAAWGLRVRVDGATTEPLQIRSRLPGDRVATPAGHRKVQDVLVDAKVPRPLRALVPILADADGALAVIGGRWQRLHSERGALTAEPFEQTWSRELAWIR